MSEEREHAPHRESHIAFLVSHHRALLAQHHLSHRERRRMETCEEILDEARTVFAETGALDFSLSEIARRVGFTPAALYRYFDSKDDLIKALAERAMAGLAEALASVPQGLPADERAVEMGMAYLAFARDNPQDIALVALHESLCMTHEGDTPALRDSCWASSARAPHRASSVPPQTRTWSSWSTGRGRWCTAWRCCWNASPERRSNVCAWPISAGSCKPS